MDNPTKKYAYGKIELRALLPKFLNKYHYGEKYAMYIRECMDRKERYEVEVVLKSNTLKVIYGGSSFKAETVMRIAKKFNIQLFKNE
jgi:hypothetical protein